jgi:hypothetical protein
MNDDRPDTTDGMAALFVLTAGKVFLVLLGLYALAVACDTSDPLTRARRMQRIEEIHSGSSGAVERTFTAPTGTTWIDRDAYGKEVR